MFALEPICYWITPTNPQNWLKILLQTRDIKQELCWNNLELYFIHLTISAFTPLNLNRCQSWTISRGALLRMNGVCNLLLCLLMVVFIVWFSLQFSWVSSRFIESGALGNSQCLLRGRFGLTFRDSLRITRIIPSSQVSRFGDFSIPSERLMKMLPVVTEPRSIDTVSGWMRT